MAYFETHSASPAPEAGLAALRNRIASLQLMHAAIRLQYIARKAGFNPNQPRVPRGNPDGGQWTSTGGSSGASGTGRPRRPKTSVPKTPSSIPKLRVPLRGIGDNSGTQLEPPPKIPTQRPLTAKARNAVVMEVAQWLGKAAIRRLAGPIGFVLDAIEVVGWMREYYPYIQSHFDEPRSLDELRKAVSNPATGYDIHHIVEQTPAEQDGFARSQINAPDNLVRVPWIKHVQISAWFARRNEDFSWRSPRDFLRDKGWDERTRVGIEALIKHGVLKRD